MRGSAVAAREGEKGEKQEVAFAEGLCGRLSAQQQERARDQGRWPRDDMEFRLLVFVCSGSGWCRCCRRARRKKCSSFSQPHAPSSLRRSHHLRPPAAQKAPTPGITIHRCCSFLYVCACGWQRPREMKAQPQQVGSLCPSACRCLSLSIRAAASDSTAPSAPAAAASRPLVLLLEAKTTDAGGGVATQRCWNWNEGEPLDCLWLTLSPSFGLAASFTVNMTHFRPAVSTPCCCSSLWSWSWPWSWSWSCACCLVVVDATHTPGLAKSTRVWQLLFLA